jgi:hypothetical protein
MNIAKKKATKVSSLNSRVGGGGEGVSAAVKIN